MTLVALLVVGGLGAAGTAWALPREGLASRVGVGGGVLALVVIAVLAAASPTPAVGAETAGGSAGTAFNGAVVAGGYLRLAVALMATSSILLCAMTWLLRGVPGLRALLPASLAALVGMTVALGASTAELGLVAAGATGLASVPVVLATRRPGATGVAAREVRIAVATALVVLAVAAVLPLLAHLAPPAPAGGASLAGSGVAAAVALGLLAVALVLGARAGTIPFHVRVSALTDSTPEGSLPLVLVWLPLPLAAVSAGVVAGDLAPLGVPVGSAQALIVALILLATAAGGLVAAFQDDLRHAVGYLTLTDLGLVVLAFAALDPAATAWGPARTWLLTVAVTKTALAAWEAVAEDRFKSRSVPDLRGWLRPSPLLGLALVLIIMATYGLPGWAVFTARLDLTRLAAQGPFDVLLLLASLLTLPAYARWLWLGLAAPTSRVDGGTPELLALRARSGRTARIPRPGVRRRGRDEGLPVEQEASAKPESKPPALVRRPAPTSPAKPWVDPEPVAAPMPGPVPGEPVAKQQLQPDAARPELELAAPSSEPRPEAEPAIPEFEPTEPPTEQRHEAETPTPDIELAAFDIEPTAQEGGPERARPKPRRESRPSAAPGLFDLPEADAPLISEPGGSAARDAADVRPGTGMGRRARTPGGTSGSSPMTAPRAPEVSKALPADLLAWDAESDGLARPGPAARARRLGAPSGADAVTRIAASARRHRTDLLSAAVLALALLAALVASGVFGVSAAACESVPAVPSVSCSQN